MGPTEKQSLGNRGERLVAEVVRCPGCKNKNGKLQLLPPNFKCADLICDFCGYLAQVKSVSVKGVLPEVCPATIIGAAWGPQEMRMEAGIFFSLFVVLENDLGLARIFFLPRDLQTREMFVPRKPLGPGAKREGWQGFKIDTRKAVAAPIPWSSEGNRVFRTRVTP